MYDYRCRVCGNVFNLLTDTVWEGTHYDCVTIVCVMRGFAQGISTLQLADELELDYGALLEQRHQIQQLALDHKPVTPLSDAVTEADEMFQNAGEKGEKHDDPNDPPRCRANNRPPPRGRWITTTHPLSEVGFSITTSGGILGYQLNVEKGQCKSPALINWIRAVAEHMPHLSKPQALVLALWSFGMVVAQSCGLTSVSAALATLLNQKDNTVRQQLREWYKEAKSQKGEHRQDLDVTTCFAPLVRWVLSHWPETEQRLALVMDAKALANLFTVLAISIVYRGCAIPVAWVILPATALGAWKEHWLALFQLLRGSVPDDWLVIVLADRGLYANWLYQASAKTGEFMLL